jgi:hypothetical protein
MASGSQFFKLQLEIGLLTICDAAIEEYNPCHIRDGGCLRGNPIPCCQGRIWNLEWRKEGGGCKFLLDAACTNLNLKCRSWICKDALEAIDTDCLDLLKKVEEIGKKYGLIGRPFLGQAHCTD